MSNKIVGSEELRNKGEILTRVMILRWCTYYDILLVYLNELTLSVCAWRWSYNLLHRNKCWCRWV